MDIFNMNHKNILITGGAGFVGSNLAIKLKQKYNNLNIIALDNLKRRGSELNISRLKELGIKFQHGDIRNKEDLNHEFDMLIECSAEPSVLAGINESPEYLINTNLIGTLNCLEAARRNQSKVIFLSTSRVYPYKLINSAKFSETETRFEFENNQDFQGISQEGITEELSLNGPRSLYGSTKLASELFITEYADTYGLETVINRFGCIAGPWQMGKIDQGVMVLWISRHIFKKSLSYIGYGGLGKQVRDFIHIDDVFEAIDLQINNFDKIKNDVFNIGGGRNISVSLKELTGICEKVTGNTIEIASVLETRPVDLKMYITDNTKIHNILNWSPKKNIETLVQEVYEWIIENKNILNNILE